MKKDFIMIILVGVILALAINLFTQTWQVEYAFSPDNLISLKEAKSIVSDFH